MLLLLALPAMVCTALIVGGSQATPSGMPIDIFAALGALGALVRVEATRNAPRPDAPAPQRPTASVPAQTPPSSAMPETPPRPPSAAVQPAPPATPAPGRALRCRRLLTLAVTAVFRRSTGSTDGRGAPGS
ncbi:hypothetical protein [Streptomyces sp. GS7]|uniref:hypothetical protein n=1 Tax=Streptomyces sp. GS7 TaxID=2692234 RepID=UPI001F3A45E5|nr:hypothetical protein [Streptomyces sp. GS7]